MYTFYLFIGFVHVRFVCLAFIAVSSSVRVRHTSVRTIRFLRRHVGAVQPRRPRPKSNSLRCWHLPRSRQRLFISRVSLNDCVSLCQQSVLRSLAHTLGRYFLFNPAFMLYMRVHRSVLSFVTIRNKKFLQQKSVLLFLYRLAISILSGIVSYRTTFLRVLCTYCCILKNKTKKFSHTYGMICMVYLCRLVSSSYITFTSFS